MNASLSFLARTVEPGQLPRRLRFYPSRRKIAAMPSVRAFAIGAALGSTATIAAAVLLVLISGCATTGKIRIHAISTKDRAAIEQTVREMDAATAGIVFYPISGAAK